MLYDSSNSIFVGFADNEKHFNIIQGYYGRMKRQKLKWSLVDQFIDTMFSNDYEGVLRKELDFYGNDGVCLFKYFVDRNDPQHKLVWAIIAIDICCVGLVTVSYVMINAISINGTVALTRAGNNEAVEKRNRKLQRKISLIIATDFLCWVPFVVVCLLHSMELFNATPWYSLFTVVFLPINSVINPLLYDDSIRDMVDRLYVKVTAWSSSTAPSNVLEMSPDVQAQV